MVFPKGASGKSTAIWLGLFLVLALTLRIVFNIGPAFDHESESYLYSGNDPWYHDRTVEHMLETGESLTFDPAINYPEGGRNPNPPVFDWTTALDAKFLDMAGATDPVGLALNLAVAFWGALTLIPVFMIANELWGRRAGLWAAFFMAISAPHIQRSVFGFADHDAPTMFFIVLTFAFLVKGLKALRNREYVPSWRDGAAEGIRRAWSDNRVALLWGSLSGIALAATALTWKGYPYALAVMAVAFGFQLLMDHVRNRDSTAVATLYLIPVALTLLVSLPYYTSLGFGASTVMPNLYVLIGMLVVGAILVPTRELPSILVFPALLLAAGLALLLMLLVFPEVGRTIFTGLGYFEQSKLYTTIAEAQRTELGFVAANFGFFTFLLAFWGFGKAVKAGYKGDAAMLLVASWAVVAGFMAFAASRFVMNAAPVFAVLAGAATSWILAKAGFDEVTRRRRQRHGQGAAGVFKSMTWKSGAVVALVALFLVLPNVWIGVDAAMSSEFERENDLVDDDPETTDRFGAFGIGFDLKTNGWLDLYNHLATLDQDVPIGERPGQIAWWDYGHWATSIGHHPTVADPFQNHYQQAGRFLASETEAEAQFWLSILLLDGDRKTNDGRSPEIQAILDDYGVDGPVIGTLDEEYAILTDAVSDEDSFAFYEDLSEATGKHIGYFAVDARMFPFSLQNSGIFYAPAFLANKNPDEFLRFVYQGQGVSLQLEQYGVDSEGNSYRLEDPRFVTADGEEWTVVNNQAFPPGRDPLLGGGQGGIPVQPNLVPTQRFFDSMYTRAYGGPSPDQSVPGEGLAHWRVIHQSENRAGTIRQAVLLEYYSGHTVSGRVVDEGGAPVSGIDVTFLDGFGAAHHEVSTDEQGRFEVTAPFGDDLKLALRDGGNVLYQEDWSLSRDDARGGSTQDVLVEVAFGSLSGVVFRDLNDDGALNQTGDEPVSGATVRYGGQTTTTGSDGRYSFAQVAPSAGAVTAVLGGLQNGTADVVVPSGEAATADIAMRAEPVSVQVTFEADGAGIVGVPIEFEGPEEKQVTSGPNGTATTTLQPGSYTARVDHTFTDSEGNEVVYRASREFTLAIGQVEFALTLQAE